MGKRRDIKRAVRRVGILLDELDEITAALSELMRWSVHETVMRKHFKLLDALDAEAPDIAAHVREQSLSIDGAKQQLAERRQKSKAVGTKTIASAARRAASD
jgi:hypothetical protein